MGFENDSPQNSSPTEKENTKTFFGLEIGDGLVYTIVIILTVIFIRQVSIVIQALG